MNEPLKIVPSKTDVECAAEIKDQIAEAIKPLLAILLDAKKQGFEVQFNIGPGPALVSLKVVKEF